MSCTVSDFRTRFPEFSNATDYPDTLIQNAIDEAKLFIDEVRFCKFYDVAVCYLSAHNVAISSGAKDGDFSSSNPNTARAVGSVSESFGTATYNNHNDSFLGSTVYGQKYLMYESRACIGGAGVA